MNRRNITLAIGVGVVVSVIPGKEFRIGSYVVCVSNSIVIPHSCYYLGLLFRVRCIGTILYCLLIVLWFREKCLNERVCFKRSKQ